MLSLGQDALILIATLGAALLFMFLLNRLWPGERRSVNNDLIGWQLTIIGTTYAVILGFMLYTVWTAYGEAQVNVDLEANALRDLYRTADALPEPQRTQLKLDARAYAGAVIDHLAAYALNLCADGNATNDHQACKKWDFLHMAV